MLCNTMFYALYVKGLNQYILNQTTFEPWPYTKVTHTESPRQKPFQ